MARWVEGDVEEARRLTLPYSSRVVKDQYGNAAVLFQSLWDTEYAQRENPGVHFDEARGIKRTTPLDQESTTR